MPDFTITSDVRPLDGALTRQFDAGATLALGNWVYVSGDTTVKKTDASTAAEVTGQVGIVVSIPGPNNGDNSVAAGGRVGVTVWGPVYTGSNTLDETKNYYASDTAGVMADAPGTVTRALGNPLGENIFFVRGSDTAPTS